MIPGKTDQGGLPRLPFAPRVEGPPPWQPSPAQKSAQDQLALLLKRIIEALGGLTTIIVVGPKGSGKSRLIEETLSDQSDIDALTLLADDLDAMDLFGEINSAASGGGALVLEARTPPETWYRDEKAPAPPDLHSRLTAAPQVVLDRPSADALVPLLISDLKRHGQRLSETELKQVAEMLPRHYGAPRAFCTALDAAPTAMKRREQLQWAAQKAEIGSR
ncbi:MAG: hypothetical protein AAF830_06520 [Pseudomonadota bacterium]